MVESLLFESDFLMFCLVLTGDSFTKLPDKFVLVLMLGFGAFFKLANWGFLEAVSLKMLVGVGSSGAIVAEVELTETIGEKSSKFCTTFSPPSSFFFFKSLVSNSLSFVCISTSMRLRRGDFSGVSCIRNPGGAALKSMRGLSRPSHGEKFIKPWLCKTLPAGVFTSLLGSSLILRATNCASFRSLSQSMLFVFPPVPPPSPRMSWSKTSSDMSLLSTSFKGNLSWVADIFQGPEMWERLPNIVEVPDMEPLDVMEAIEGFCETDKLLSLVVVLDLEKGESELSEICTKTPVLGLLLWVSPSPWLALFLERTPNVSSSDNVLIVVP
jgi:hypothetical protein